jgi:hypothetical protein
MWNPSDDADAVARESITAHTAPVHPVSALARFWYALA